MYTILFCVLPILIALMPYILVALQTYVTILAEAQREELARQRVQALQERTATAQALREAKLAKESNALVLQDIKIETEKLKQQQLKQKLGMTAEEFTPRDYEL
jgi:hypothetical protein